jgi:hypothetical protein
MQQYERARRMQVLHAATNIAVAEAGPAWLFTATFTHAADDPAASAVLAQSPESTFVLFRLLT